LSILEKLRFYHAALALSASAAYATGELGFIHAWLGYLVAGIIVMRLLWGLVGPRQIGISRFIPDFSDVTSARLLDHPVVSRILISGIALSLVVVSATGIAMDRFSSLGSTHRVETVAQHGSPRGELVGARTAMAHSSVFVAAREEAEDENEREDWIKELHEASANLMLALVVLHVTYLLLFKRKLAFFMLFRSSPRSSGVSAPNQA
jgi:cytochrome b